MAYSDVINSLTGEQGKFEARVGEDWTQGRSIYGGMQTALAIKAMGQILATPMPLRSVQTSFLAPVPPGTVSIQAALIRTGKNTQHCEARIVNSDGQPLCLVVGIFGVAIESAVNVAAQLPTIPDKPPFKFPYIPNLTPEFTQHFDAQWLQGYLPYSGQPQIHSQVELQLANSGETDFAYIAAIADYMPPMALAHLSKPTPASSLTWMLEFLSDPTAADNSHWRIAAELEAAQGGYSSQSTLIVDAAGKAVASGRQNMVIFG